MLILPAVMAGCRGSIPEQVFTKTAPTTQPAFRDSTDDVWRPRAAEVSGAFVIDQTATLQVDQDSTTRTDTVASHTEFTMTRSRDGRIAGTITAFRARAAGSPTGTPASTAPPAPFDASISADGIIHVPVPPGESPGAPCSGVTSAGVLASRDLWFRLPDSLHPGSTWSDSSSTQTCRDGVPLRLSVRRRYVVERTERRDSVLVFIIRRTQQLHLEGAGAQWGERVRVTGSGSGTMTLAVAARTEALLTASGTSTLDLTFTGSRRTQRVHQRLATEARGAEIK